MEPTFAKLSCPCSVNFSILFCVVFLFNKAVFSAPQTTGYVAVDHKGDVSADGQVLVNKFSNWKNAELVEIPANAQSVVIRVTKKNNKHSTGGILASFDNGLRTNSSWRCTDNVTRMEMWPQAHEVARNDGKDGQWNEVVGNINSNAAWIWTANEGDSEVWCRKFLGGLKYLPGWLVVKGVNKGYKRHIWQLYNVLKSYNELQSYLKRGSVVRNLDSANHRIVIFSAVLKTPVKQ